MDLCWKLDALVWLGRDKYKTEIAALVNEIFEHQKPDGSWAMPFGMEEIQYDFQRQRVNVKQLPKLAGNDGPRASEFQTWHAIYALARAGVTGADARLKKAVDLCLSRQQPFGGSRASGTNDKAGSILNLMRWVSPRAIKETFVPPTDWRYPFLAPD